MIVPMRHVTLLCLASSRGQALETLADLGVLHLEVNVAAGQPTGEAGDLRRQWRRSRAALQEIELIAQEAGDGKARRRAAGSRQDFSLDKVTQEVESFNRRTRQAESLRRDLVQWRPFGSFDPAWITRLREEGVAVHLFRCDASAAPEPEAGGAVRILHRDHHHAWGVAVGTEEAPAGCSTLPLPDRHTAELEKEYQALAGEIRRQRELLLALHRHLARWRRELLEIEDRLAAAHALDAMGRQGELAWLTGFCPVSGIDDLRREAARSGWGIVHREPRPEEAVPTLIRRPRWLKPVKSVFDILGINPGYREADISAVFMVFFTVFFALLIGDAGYGGLILAATLMARKKMPGAPGYPFAMLILLSLATMVWGALSGNYFGIPPAALPQLLRPPDHLLEKMRDREVMMGLCFIIGAVHLTLAHLWNALVLWPSAKALAQAGWVVLVWSMYYTARGMVLASAGFPSLLPWAFLAGLLLVVFFMTGRDEFRHRWIDHAMLPLSLAGCLVDVISYIRLYAVGVATLQVAESFNQMALSFDLPLLLRLPLVALVLILGHALNIALCGLGILVHAVRLNTLEFSQHKGLEWAGFAYNPFSRRAPRRAAP